MDESIVKLTRGALTFVILLFFSSMVSTQTVAQSDKPAGPTFKETHALIKELILGKLILQNHWHKTDFPQYNHFDDAIWSIILYSGSECEVTYRRKFEISHHSTNPIERTSGAAETYTAYKTARFDMAQIESIELHDYGDSRGSFPSIGIRFIGPVIEWHTVVDEPDEKTRAKATIQKEEHAISVFAKDSGRILSAFRHLHKLCRTKNDHSN